MTSDEFQMHLNIDFRSPSDSSIMYLNQLGLKAKTDKMWMVRNSKKLNGKCDDDDDNNFVNDNNVANDRSTSECRTNPEMKLPAKKKIFLRENLKTGNGEYQESIYDCVPKPRSCLRDDQVKTTSIFIVICLKTKHEKVC